MNVKAILLATLVLGLIAVPLGAASPIMAQNGDTLQTEGQFQDKLQDQSQLQTKDCTASPTTQGEASQTQDQLRIQDRQQLQSQDCASTGFSQILQTDEPQLTRDQNQTQTQEQQQLRTRDCNGSGTCNGDCNQTQQQTQKRLKECDGNQVVVNSNGDAEQNCYCNAYGYQRQNWHGGSTAP